jgi:hypothetical protein
VIILQTLSIPTIFATFLGGLIGYGASFVTNHINNKKDDKKWRQSIAEQIFKQIYSYNGVAINVLSFFNKPEIFLISV